MKKMKGIFGVILSLVLMLTLTSVPVSAATVSDGLDFTNTTADVDGTSDGYYWDHDSSTLTVTGLTIYTSDQYALQLPKDSTIVLEGDLNATTTHADNTAYALYVAGNLTVNGTGNIMLNSTGYGLSGYDMSISCNTLEINSSLDSIAAGNLSIVTEGNVNLTTTASSFENAGIYTWGDVSITSSCDLVINAEDASGIYVEVYEESNTITFDVSRETNINGAYALYLDGSTYDDDTSTTIINNGGAVYFNGSEYAIGYRSNSYYYNFNAYEVDSDPVYSLTLQGSGEFYTNGTVYLDNLTVEGNASLIASEVVAALQSFTLGADATAEIAILGMEGFVIYDIYGYLYAGMLIGNEVNIYDGATVIVDTSLLDDVNHDMDLLLAIALLGVEDFVPSINLDDNVILYTPESPAGIALGQYEGMYIMTVTIDGEDWIWDEETGEHNASMYVVFTTIYDIDVTVTGEGSVTPDTSSVVKGEDVTYTFTADEGYEVSEVIVDGVSVDVTTSYTFEGIVEDHTLEVVFSEIVVEDNTDLNTDADTDAEVDTDVGDTTVDTSDSTNVVGLTMMSLLSLLGIVIFRRRQLVK